MPKRRFLNHYKWSTRSLIRTVRSCILNLILSQRPRGRKPTLQVMLDLTTLEKVGQFPHLQDRERVYNHKKGLLGVYRWLILSFVSYLLAYWVYLHLGALDNLDWFDSAQQALILLLPHVLLLSLLTQLQIVIPWLNERGFELCLIRNSNGSI